MSTSYQAATASNHDIRQLSGLLKASCDVLRLEILRVLDKKSFGVQELCTIFSIRQSAMSHHLKQLAQADLVVTRREGNSIFYHRHHQAPETLQMLWHSLLTTLDRLPLRPELAAGIKAVHEDRAASSRLFFEQNAGRFRAQQELIADFEQYAEPIRQFIRCAELPDHGLALEIGPGEGGFLSELSALFQRVIALDISPQMLALAQAHANAQQLDNIEFLHAGCTEALAMRLQPDCIIANMVLHHVPSPVDMLQEIAALLRPGGSVFLADLCRHDQSWTRDACGDIWLGLDPDDLTHWAEGAGLLSSRHLYFAQRNGFSVQIRQFTKPVQGKVATANRGDADPSTQPQVTVTTPNTR